MNKRKNVVLPTEFVREQKAVIADIRMLNDEDFKINPTRKSAFVETYGCQQNKSDSEIISGMLCAMGYELTTVKESADIIIYNTCAVRENAELKVFGNLGALKNLKARKPELIIGVCGCMMQQKDVADRIRAKYKHVDLVFGTHSLYYFPTLLSEVLKSHKRVIDVRETDGAIAEDYPIVREEGPCAWVSIMYGCNNFCTYCIVPYVRGRERSRNADAILKEVKTLADKGCKEVTLLGQNVNSYGNDLEENIDFADLLSLVCKTDGIERVRFMTSHPKDISDKLIQTMAENSKICNQLHLPLQAGSDRILKIMNRKYTTEQYLEKTDKVRSAMPDITLTTDIIVGFPGETNEDFEKTLEMLKKVRYDTIFSFIYSRRNGTPAAKMEDVLTDEEKKLNFNRMLEVQDKISIEKNKALENRIMKVLIEGKSKHDPNVLSGKTEGGKTVNIKAPKELIGKIADVRITEAKTWSLYGELI